MQKIWLVHYLHYFQYLLKSLIAGVLKLPGFSFFPADLNYQRIRIFVFRAVGVTETKPHPENVIFFKKKFICNNDSFRM